MPLLLRRAAKARDNAAAAAYLDRIMNDRALQILDVAIPTAGM